MRKVHDYSPKWYIDEEEFTKPSTMKADMDVNTAAICFEDGFYELLVDELDADRELKGLPAMLEGKKSKEVAVIKSYFGAPASAMLLEALAASGVNRVFMLGEAGSIGPKSNIGDVVVPTWGIREEGTSYHYFPPEHEVTPSKPLTKQFLDTFDSEVKKGGIWTIDAGFRETKGKINNYSHRGIMAVDMECTALMAVAEYRDIDFTAAVVITDELFTDSWVRGFKSDKVKKGKKRIVDALKKYTSK